MWLFVAKPLLNAKNVINGHSLYVLYDILCPCNQCFWVKVPFITFMWLLATKSHIAPKQIRWPICFTWTHPFSRNQLTTLGFYMQIPILMIMAYTLGKRDLWIWSWLATNIHKETLTLGLHSVTDVRTCFRCNHKVKKLNVVWKIMVLVKN